MLKKFLIPMLIGLMILSIASCTKINEEGLNIPSEGTYTIYKEVKESVPNNVIKAELDFYDEDKILREAEFIFKGEVVDEKEIGLEEYMDGELQNIYYRDVFTVKITKVYYLKDSSLKEGDIVKVANVSCSNNWYKGTIEIEKNKEYVLITQKSRDTNTVEFSKYHDFSVIQPWMAIIIIENGNYIFDEVFTSLISGKEEEKIREDGSFKTKMYKEGKEFEKKLKDLIAKKKGEV